jgi:hypothetical protein
VAKILDKTVHDQHAARRGKLFTGRSDAAAR